MFKNYLKIVLRNIKKQKAFNLINLIGFSIGIACCILILLYVFHELSFDKFHDKGDRIYRVTSSGKIVDIEVNSISTPSPLANALKTQCPEVEQTLRIMSRGRNQIVSNSQKTFREKSSIIAADKNFFGFFSFPLEMGNSETALSNPFTVVITKEIAEKYFRNENPLNKILKISDQEYTITGVLKDIPNNSSLRFSFLLSILSFNQQANNHSWLHVYSDTFVLLHPNRHPDEITAKLSNLVQKNISSVNEQFKNWEYNLEPLNRIHLYSNIPSSYGVSGNILYVYVFSIIAFFILIIASFNFINLSNVQSLRRSKEIGLRKVLGSNRLMLISQFLMESTLLSFFSVIMSLVLVYLALPYYKNLIGREINLNLFSNPLILLSLIGLSLCLGILSGIIPAFYISSFTPISTIKKQFIKKKGAGKFKNSLVIYQFAISIFLISSTFIIFSQLHFMKTKNLEFDKEHVVVIRNQRILGNRNNAIRLKAFKNKLKQNPEILSVSNTSNLPGVGTGVTTFLSIPEGHETLHLNYIRADEDFLDLFKIKLSKGRYFSKGSPNENNSIVINETTADQLGWKEPVGKKIKIGSSERQVIGVVKNFHYKSLFQKIDKLGIILSNGESYMTVRLRSSKTENVLKFIETTWASFSPDIPVNFSFLSEDFNQVYMFEQKTGYLISIFTTLAILISCLGLLALSAFTIHQRVKEISIRKVLGASVNNIFILLSQNFFKIIILANLIAWPFIYYIMDRWLQNFSYRINIDFKSIIISGLLAGAIGLLIVLYHTAKAATINPITSLKDE